VYVKGRRDAELTQALLARDGIESDVCSDIEDVCARIEGGAVAALIAEEILTPEAIARLARELERQPPWSDFPIVVFSALGNTAVRGFADAARVLGNVTFLERPVQVRSMLAALHVAVRSRRRQYEARRAIESRDAFLAMLGHELRNPLGAIRLAIAALERKTDEHARPMELRVLARQSSHLARLVDELLDVARVTHGKVVLRRARLDLVEVVRRAFETLEGRAVEHGLGYELDVEPREVWVNGDPQRLEQVFSNLLTNAIKYTPAGGRVRALVRVEGAEAVVSVADTGIGIASEMLGRVFEVFTQIEPSPDRSQGGMGLGLALVERIVALHGGVVEAESAGLG
jgi:signal transduction histidine kinase